MKAMQIPEQTYDFSVRHTPAGAVFTMICPTCGAKLGSFVVVAGQPKGKLAPNWWKCPNGCNVADAEEMDA